MKCNNCKLDITEENYEELILDGTEDTYKLELCSYCYETLNDYFTAEEVEDIISNMK